MHPGARDGRDAGSLPVADSSSSHVGGTVAFSSNKPRTGWSWSRHAYGESRTGVGEFRPTPRWMVDDLDLALYTGLDGMAVLEPKMYAYPGFLVPLAFLLVSWILWSLVLVRFMKRGQPVDRIGRLTGLLFAGTLVELILLVPLEAMVRRRADCYCATGSFQALVGGVVAALWLLGPVAFLVLLRRRPAWWARHCQQCGYEKGPGATGQCPECGGAWGEDREMA